MRFAQGRLIQFAKAPQLGKVKTRLQPHLSEAAALDLHCRLVTHTFNRLLAADLASVELWVSEESPAFFRPLTAGKPCGLRVQRGSDLGVRMFNALTDAPEHIEFSVVIGSDCPILDADYLISALDQLASGTPVVIGPADDGGYVLIGARQPAVNIFTGVDWGSSRVMEQTRQRCVDLGVKWSELPMLWDVDRAKDLNKLRKLVKQSPTEYAALSSFDFEALRFPL